MTYLLFLLFITLSRQSFARDQLQPQPLDQESYAEAFTAVVYFEGGHFALLQILISNAGVGDQKAACRVLWVPNGQNGINAAIKGSQNSWSFNSSARRLRVSQCHLSASNGKTIFHAEAKNIAVELQFFTLPSTTRTPESKVVIGQQFHESTLLIPWSKIKATIKSGDVRSAMTGMGHLDHSRSNLFLPKIANKWYRFRGFFGSHPFLVQLRIPPDKSSPRGWILSKLGSKGSSLKNNAINITQTGSGLEISLKTNEGVIKIHTRKRIYFYEPINSYGIMGKLARPWIGNPTTTTYHASAFTPNGEIRGVLEVLSTED